MDDLDLVDSAFVVTVLSRRGVVPPNGRQREERDGRALRGEARLPVCRTQPGAQAREVGRALVIQADELAVGQEPPPEFARQRRKLGEGVGAVAARSRAQAELALVEPELGPHAVELDLERPAPRVARDARSIGETKRGSCSRASAA
jgi:hypothetical protein